MEEQERKRVSRGILILLLALVLGLVVAPAIEGSAVTERGSLFGVTTSQKVVGLTFDDGPDPRWTPQVVDLLQKDRARATFFVVGGRVVAHPELVARELQAGNEVGNHTWSHPHLRRVTPAVVEDQLSRTDAAIRKAGAPAPRYFRPPYGAGDATVAMIASAHGYRTVYWGVCVEKYADHNATRQTVQDVLKRVHPGMIILAHDGGPPDRSRTLAVLPGVLQGLTREGYRVDSVSGLLRVAGEPHQAVHRLSSRRLPALQHAVVRRLSSRRLPALQHAVVRRLPSRRLPALQHAAR